LEFAEAGRASLQSGNGSERKKYSNCCFVISAFLEVPWLTRIENKGLRALASQLHRHRLQVRAPQLRRPAQALRPGPHQQHRGEGERDVVFQKASPISMRLSITRLSRLLIRRVR